MDTLRDRGKLLPDELGDGVLQHAGMALNDRPRDLLTRALAHRRGGYEETACAFGAEESQDRRSPVRNPNGCTTTPRIQPQNAAGAPPASSPGRCRPD